MPASELHAGALTLVRIFEAQVAVAYLDPLTASLRGCSVLVRIARAVAIVLCGSRGRALLFGLVFLPGASSGLNPRCETACLRRTFHWGEARHMAPENFTAGCQVGEDGPHSGSLFMRRLWAQFAAMSRRASKWPLRGDFYHSLSRSSAAYEPGEELSPTCDSAVKTSGLFRRKRAACHCA